MCGKLTAYIIAFLFMASAQIAGSPPSDIGKTQMQRDIRSLLSLRQSSCRAIVKKSRKDCMASKK